MQTFLRLLCRILQTVSRWRIFVILDERRAAAGIHPAGKAWFLTKLSKQELDTLQQAGQQKDENEQEIEVLFQSFLSVSFNP